MNQYAPPRGVNPTEKLVWLFIKLNEDERHSVRSLARALDLSNDAAARALKHLQREKLLEVVEPHRGSISGRYRAVLETVATAWGEQHENYHHP
ncbi:MAG: MarR family transcriptional regulator [Deinococcota bacterium]|nr:MarR family transcriptional regulator [Deinococcota bacterium]